MDGVSFSLREMGLTVLATFCVSSQDKDIWTETRHGSLFYSSNLDLVHMSCTSAVANIGWSPADCRTKPPTL